MKHTLRYWSSLLGILSISLGWAGCSGKPGGQEGQAGAENDSAAAGAPAKPDTLAYTLLTVDYRDPACPAGSRPEACTHASVIYPDLAGSGAPVHLVANLLRDVTLATGLASDTMKRLPSLEKVTQAFVDSFRAERAIYQKLDPEAKAMPWILDIRSRLTEASGLVFLEADGFVFTGGAHPSTTTQFRAYDRVTGAPVALGNLVQDDKAMTALVSQAEKKFRAQEGLRPNSGYKDYFFKDKIFSLPRNWRIRKDSLEFVYNIYEIKPYVAGPTVVRLPLAAVDTLFTPAYRRKAA